MLFDIKALKHKGSLLIVKLGNALTDRCEMGDRVLFRSDTVKL